MKETAAKYATPPPPSFQKLVDKLLEAVVTPRLTTEVRLFFVDGGINELVIIQRVEGDKWKGLFEHVRLI